MFKIVKKKVHRGQYNSRQCLNLKRTTGAHSHLLELIDNFKKESKKNFYPLRGFLEDEMQKVHVRAWIQNESFLAFDTAWEGALTLLATIEREEDPRVKKADMDLLLDDLSKIKEFLKPRAVC